MSSSDLKISPVLLKAAVDFHGHLGPYLVLGLIMGNLAVKKLRLKRHFGVKAVISGAMNKPKSCLIDGIQISTGCTYGKGNISKRAGKKIQALFYNIKNNNTLKIGLKDDLTQQLTGLTGHKESEAFARCLLKINPHELFNFN